MKLSHVFWAAVLVLLFVTGCEAVQEVVKYLGTPGASGVTPGDAAGQVVSGIGGLLPGPIGLGIVVVGKLMSRWFQPKIIQRVIGGTDNTSSTWQLGLATAVFALFEPWLAKFGVSMTQFLAILGTSGFVMFKQAAADHGKEAAKINVASK